MRAIEHLRNLAYTPPCAVTLLLHSHHIFPPQYAPPRLPLFFFGVTSVRFEMLGPLIGRDLLVFRMLDGTFGGFMLHPPDV